MRSIQTIAALVALTLAGAAALSHPPGDDHAHPHGGKHATVPPDAERFITNRQSKVILPLPSEQDTFFFVVFGDRTGGPAEGVKVLAQAVKDTNLLGPDLVMTVGDLVEGYNQREQWLAQMREFKGIMDGLICPWFPVAGNHDIYWRGEGRPPEEHEGDYEEHFGPLWYAFEHKNCWFIALYSDEPDPETGIRDFNRPPSQRMSPEQFAWLKDTLAKARGADHVFLFLHHPRWLGGNYGDDWEKVHRALVEAGNVTAVFAGHIHQMRSDGPRDGIEYITLATVGGSQSGKVPQAGFLHQFHVVTVRKDRIALASLPVGGVMDVRAITGQVSTETARLADTRPSFAERLAVSGDGAADGVVRVKYENPVSRPVAVTLTPASSDSRWLFSPDHRHQVIAPGESHTFEFRVWRGGGAVDATWRSPVMLTDVDYLAETARFSIPTAAHDLPLHIDLPLPVKPAAESVLSIDGRRDYAAVPNDLIELPDGPMTIECWFRARSFGERVGLIAKTENSDYGVFVSKGQPSFSIWLGDRYAEPSAKAPMLKTGVWHHVAGVYDGTEARLYVDGALVATVTRSGARRRNAFPFMIGADVDGAGRAMSFFDGEIDEVRVSTISRYAGESFTPARRFEADEFTRLLLHMDGTVGPWLPDAATGKAHATMHGGARIAPATPDKERP